MPQIYGGSGGGVYGGAGAFGFFTGGTIDGTPIGATTPAAVTGTTVTATTGFIGPAGAVGTPSIYLSTDTTTGPYRSAANVWAWTVSGAGYLRQHSTGFYGLSTGNFAYGWESSHGGGFVTSMAHVANNSIQFGAGIATAGAATARTEINKTTTAIADNVATAVLTITIPNAAHSGSVRVRVTGSAGAGGAIGANEATATNEYIVTLTRTAGVNAVAAISAAYGAGAATVAGGNAVTATAAMSAVSGAVGATNTFTVNVTIARAAGSATNHTCLVYAQLMNANATGITLS